MKFLKDSPSKNFLYTVILALVTIGSLNGLIEMISTFNLIKIIFNFIGLPSVPAIIFITCSISAILYHIVNIFMILYILE